MKTSSIVLIPLAALALAGPARAQAPAETILRAIVPSSEAQVKAANATATTPRAETPAPAPAAGAVVKPTPKPPAFNPPHATVFSDNSSPSRDQTVHYYLPVGAVSRQSGIRTYPGSTAAKITNGSTHSNRGFAAGSTAARLAGSTGSRASLPSTKAPTVSTR